MKKIFLLLLASFSLFCFAQNNPRKIIFQKTDVITNVEEYNKGLLHTIEEAFTMMQNVSVNLFNKDDLYNTEEFNQDFDSLKIEILKNKNVDLTNNDELFLTKKFNDSIFKVRNILKNDSLNINDNNRFINILTRKRYYDFDYSKYEQGINLKYDKIENFNLVEDKKQIKTINGIKTYKVIASYTKINPANIDNDFPEFNEPETKDFINIEMWVTSEIKHFYHPIINVKEIIDKYYPLEFKITDSSIPGTESNYTIYKLELQKKD